MLNKKKFVLLSLVSLVAYFGTVALILAAPTYIILRGIVPETANTYDLGLTGTRWNRIYVNYASSTATSADTVCIGGTCNTSWPATSELYTGTVSTSTSPTRGNLAYWTSKDAWPELLGTVATTTLTATGLISLSQPIFVIGSSASVLSLSGDVITYSAATSSLKVLTGLTNASSTQLTITDLFISADQISDFQGDGFALSGTTLIFDCSDVASTGLTCVGEDLTVDLGTSIDISAETNLAATYPITLTGDAIGIAFGTTTSNTWADTQTFGAVSFSDNAIAEADISFATACGTGNHLYISGGNLACEADDDVPESTDFDALILHPSFSYATTSWTGTTTIPLGTAYVAETWTGVQCFTNAGTLQVSFNDGTNRMNFMTASTTVGTVELGTNNSFVAAEKRYADIGTPATSPTKISCTIKKTITGN